MVKNPPENAGDKGDIGLPPGSGRPPGGGRGNPPQYSCLENPMDRAWRATVHRNSESDMTERLSAHALKLLIGSHTHGFQKLGGLFFGRNDAKAETPVLWLPRVKN